MILVLLNRDVLEMLLLREEKYEGFYVYKHVVMGHLYLSLREEELYEAAWVNQSSLCSKIPYVDLLLLQRC